MAIWRGEDKDKGDACVSVTRNESDVMKGILIFLIVLGHNHILSPNTEAHGLMDYLYLFHVQCFFILPFFYKCSSGIGWGKIARVVVRNWWPYLWVCALCFGVSALWYGQSSISWDTLWAFLQGTQSPIRRHFGFVFPWFLPTYCSFTLLLIAARRWRCLYWAFLVASLVTWTLTWGQFYQFKNTVPFGLGLALHYFASGVLAYELYRRWPKSRVVGLVSFGILSVLWWCKIDVPYVYCLMPTLFFLGLLVLVPHCQWTWLKRMGRCSLGIYLFHMFLVNIFCRLLPHNFVGGVVSFLASLLVSWGIVYGIERVAWLRRLLFLK